MSNIGDEILRSRFGVANSYLAKVASDPNSTTEDFRVANAEVTRLLKEMQQRGMV